MAHGVLSAGRVLATVGVVGSLSRRLPRGDPAAVIAGDTAPAEQVAEIRSKLGLDKPIFQQFFIWAGRSLKGDFGDSFFFKKPVAELITQRIEPTLSLAIVTIVLAVLIAVPLGVLAAQHAGSVLDRCLMGFSVLGFSVPVFVIGYLLIYIFAIKINCLPVQGYRRIAQNFADWAVHLVLPSLTLAVIYVALIARMTRASVIEVLTEDY